MYVITMYEHEVGASPMALVTGSCCTWYNSKYLSVDLRGVSVNIVILFLVANA
jgi:hypothetical protein